MNFGGDKSRLLGVTKELGQQWERARNYWQDAKGAEFEHRYLDELNVSVNRALVVIEKLDELLKKMKEECE
ncbi:MAG TPA: hypothetical protein VGO57_03480 [Verrucomicrobiae bacterium]|jgi:ATP:corrinoid adenosyltransferase